MLFFPFLGKPNFSAMFFIQNMDIVTGGTAVSISKKVTNCEEFMYYGVEYHYPEEPKRDLL